MNVIIIILLIINLLVSLWLLNQSRHSEYYAKPTPTTKAPTIKPRKRPY